MQRNLLLPPALLPLRLGAIRPTGWLLRQLHLQAGGISGHLDEFWPDVRDSRWFGGDAEGWERAPYWLDGVVPLAYLLDDGALRAKVERYLDYILTHQGEDGWLGPREMVVLAGGPESARYDLWGQLLMGKVLVQYYEGSGDERVPGALARNLRCMDGHIDRTPLFNWGQFRWFEGLIGLYWLYERTGEGWLLDLAVKLHAQGFGWADFFARWPLTEPTPKGRWNFAGHVVNNAMALKAHALWWRMSGAERDWAAAYEMIALLDRHHGMVTGVFSGDECIAGRSPTQGTELCAVVETAYSLEVLLSVLGEASFGDRLEKIVFNALPATFSPDMWAHQYDQQVNQVECSIAANRPWTTNGPDANTFGVEPNYGCCTANLSQGWPKFAAHLWMRTPADGPSGEGLAAVAYAPSTVMTQVQGVGVTVAQETDYPFRPDLHVTLVTEKPLRFPLWLRIPAWAHGARLEVSPREVVWPEPGAFFRLEREWSGSSEVTLTLPMAPRLTRRGQGAVALERGPLVYALKIGEDWRRIHEGWPYRELPHGDWEVYPTSPWNYALDVDEATLATDVEFRERPVAERPFSPEGAPIAARVRGRRVPEWGMEFGSAAPVPPSPVASSEPLEELTLIPYGCTNLRITEFPVLAR